MGLGVDDGEEGWRGMINRREDESNMLKHDKTVATFVSKHKPQLSVDMERAVNHIYGKQDLWGGWCERTGEQ